MRVQENVPGAASIDGAEAGSYLWLITVLIES
jgi:hypothetical protein